MFHQKIKKAFNRHGFPLTTNQLEQLTLFRTELQRWNSHMNLTTLQDDDEIIYKHFLDSISVLKHITIGEGQKVIDIGTGAGFPGVMLKIYIPNIRLTLVEASHKKVAFLKFLISQLGFDVSPSVLAIRAENYVKTAVFLNTYDWVFTRYVASIADSAAYCLPLLKSSGRWIAYKSCEIDAEIEHSRNTLNLCGAEIENIYASTIDELNRTFVVIRKIIK